MKQLVLCGIGLTTLLLISCNGTNFSSGNGGTDATVTTNGATSTSSTVLTTDYCDGTVTDFTTVQTALLNQLQSLLSEYSSATTTTSGTYNYNNRNYQASRQIIQAEQVVASATSFTSEFNSVLQYVCNKVYGTSTTSDGYYSDQQDQYGNGQRRGHHGQLPQQQQDCDQGGNSNQQQQQRPPFPPQGQSQGGFNQGQGGFGGQQMPPPQFQNGQQCPNGYNCNQGF